jgi:hypothetical protein
MMMMRMMMMMSIIMISIMMSMVVMMIIAMTIIHYNLGLFDYSLGILLSSLFQMNINNIRYFLEDNVIQGIILD